MKLKLATILIATFLPGAAAFAGSVLVYRNSGWRISDWKYQLGNAAPVADGWHQPGFDDGAWQTGKGGFGHGAAVRFGTVLKEMPGVFSTIYLRTTFLVSDRAKLNDLILDVNFSGGFVAWINGVRVAERNAPGQLSPAAAATANRKITPGDYESIPLRNSAAFLRNGENVLAIQAFSERRDAAEFFIDAGLVNTRSLAHNKSAFASSAGMGPNRNKQFVLPFNAVDGSHMTFFMSDPAAPQWFTVDLGRETAIDKVRYHWWGDRQPRNFTVQVSSDAASWTDVYTAKAAKKSVRTDAVFPARAARYVRIHVTGMLDEKYGLFFGEVEVLARGVDFEPTEFDSLATGRRVTASSETKPGSFHGSADMAVNGHGLSWWTSKPEDPQWLAVDLGARQPINRVRLYAKENVKTFTIQVSDDGAAWKDVPMRNHTTRIAAGDIKLIVDLHFTSEMHARHVRFFGTEREKPEHGYGIVELAVFRDVR